jgi:hypothetical protein
MGLRAGLSFTVSGLLGLGLSVACATTALPPEAAPPRRVELNHTLNTRDLGGYVNENGRSIRWGVLYRSDEFDQIDDDDIQVLAAQGLRTVYDFRSESERGGREDRLPRPSLATSAGPGICRRRCSSPR